jgi:hypothetical protein
VSALEGRPTEALDYLRQALEAGHSLDREQLMRDSDFDSLHDLPEFQTLLNGIGADGEQR